VKRPNPGGDFEAAILRSLPDRADVWRRKSPTPPRPAPVAELCGEIGRRAREAERLGVRLRAALDSLGEWMLERKPEFGPLRSPGWANGFQGILEGLAEAGAPIPEWVQSAEYLGSQFTPPAGVDIYATAPARNCGPMEPTPDGIGQRFRPAPPLVAFAFELKSVAEARVPFDALRKPQDQELLRCAAGGHVAGALIEFRLDPRQCWFLAVEAWKARRATSDRKSMSPEIVQGAGGIRIELDAGRGRVRSYWKMGEFLRRFGAEV